MILHLYNLSLTVFVSFELATRIIGGGVGVELAPNA